MNTVNIDLALLRTVIRNLNYKSDEPGEKQEISEKEKAAVQLNTERLKLIDDISRLILELKTRFPELAQNLSKAREYVSTNQENIPIKKLMNLLNAIQQNLSPIENKPVETIKNLVSETVKILQPKNTEIPQENKLIIALSKNDFATANIAIKNIVERIYPAIASQPLPQIQTPVQTPTTTTIPTPTPTHTPTPTTTPASIPVQAPTPPPSPQTYQVIFNALQELKELGIPREFQKAPLKELEAIAIQKTAIEIPKDMPKEAIKNLLTAFNDKPVFATVVVKPESISISFPTPTRIENIEIPLPKNFPLQNIFVQEQPQKITQTTTTNNTTIITAPATTPATTTITQIATPTAQAIATPTSTPTQTTTANPTNPVTIPQTPTVAFSLYQILPEPRVQPQNPNQQILIPNPQSPIPNPQFFLQPWPASTLIPKEEINFWTKTELPLTPQILNVRETILSFGKLPENPEPVRLFASGMHELSLQTENGKPVTKEQENLLWRVVNAIDNGQRTMDNGQLIMNNEKNLNLRPNSQFSILNSQLSQIISSGFLKYQPFGNFEGELFKNLPEPVKKELLKELPAHKTWQPEVLQKAVEKVLEKYIEQPSNANLNEHAKKTHEETRQILQNLKEQIQWTRIDQDTRPANDRENVFYFMHEGELQKGRLKVKDQRKGGKKQHDSGISFTIETKTKNLGNVHADLTLSKNILNISLQDEVGTASAAVSEERKTLAKELADIGITLGQLLYGKTPKTQTIPITEKKEKNGKLDLKA